VFGDCRSRQRIVRCGGYITTGLRLALDSMATYDALHRQCRTLESLFDAKLTTYTRLASSISRGEHNDLEASGSNERWKDVELEVEDLLEKVKIMLTTSSPSLTVLLCAAS
jgi:hypothetical protein